MYTSCKRDGIAGDKIGKKGVLLARRDNSLFIKIVYEAIISKIFKKVDKDDILYYILEQFNILCSGSFPFKYFVVTKSLGSIGDGNVEIFVNERGVKKARMGDYTLPLLPIDPDERDKKLRSKEVATAKEFYLKSLPAQVQLAVKMRNRGMRVDPGSRLEYVITTTGGHDGHQYEKIEDIVYFNKFSHILKIDYMYYLKNCVNSFDQVLNIMYQKDKNFKVDFVLSQYKFRLKRQLVLNELLSHFNSKLIFE